MRQSDAAFVTRDTDINHVIRGDVDVAAWVRETAAHHGVVLAEASVDVFANAVSRLSDAEVRLDPIEQLLLALERAEIVVGRQGVLLHAAYLRQKA